MSVTEMILLIFFMATIMILPLLRDEIEFRGFSVFSLLWATAFLGMMLLIGWLFYRFYAELLKL